MVTVSEGAHSTVTDFLFQALSVLGFECGLGHLADLLFQRHLLDEFIREAQPVVSGG